MTTAGPRAAPNRRAGAGLTLAVLSAATFSTSGTFGSALIDHGWSPAAAVLVRIAAAAAVLTAPALLRLRGQWSRLWRAWPRVSAYGLIAIAGCQLFYFNALQRIPVGVALLLEYLGTVMVVLWVWLRHGERPRRLTVLGTVASMAGLAMVLDLTGAARIDLIGVLWGLLAAAGLAVYFVLSASAEDPLPPIVMVWAGMCVGAAALGLLGLAGAFRVRVSAADVSLLGYRVSWIVPVIGLALVAAAIAYVAGIGAARRLGAKLASFIGMAEVLFAVLFAWLLLGQLPAVMQFLGGAFILAGIILVRAGEPQARSGARGRLTGPPPAHPSGRTPGGVGPIGRSVVQAGLRATPPNNP